ncbi:MAG: ABC transporter ATP-binding protein, partial [Aliifodinibius sp.]|nr:ABC transporter ATP-binding protein [Fodinibius sp.]
INASILGFSNKHINRLFDQIVDFSGLEEYIDMPVQSYSSGMVVRLGFSVAAHLEPDILLVDEVLAVGDLAFKTK